MTSPARSNAPAFGEALRFWLWLGCVSFGGPAGQIAIMHGELVDRRRWIHEQAFLRALNFCMLLPGPEAMQLATWLGWRLHGLRGGIAAGALFVMPAALVMALLSWVYLNYQHLPQMGDAMFGLQAAVLGIIVHAAQRIGGRVLRTPFAMTLAAMALVAIAMGVSFPWVLLVSAMAGWWARHHRARWLPASDDAGTPTGHARVTRVQLWRAVRMAAACALLWWLPIAGLGLWLGPESTAFAMGIFFSKTALLTLGGAYAVLPYVAAQAVETHGWLSPEQMMTGLGLAESTPGPLILVLEFVGFAGGWQHPDLASPLASGLLGATVSLWATFLPSFLFVLTAAPWIERIGSWPRANAMLGAVTATVVGVIAHLALWFGWRLLAAQSLEGALFALVIAAVVYTGLSRWRWPMAAIVAAAMAAGVAVRMLTR